MMVKVYSAYANDKQLLRKSSSGGLFTLLAKLVIERGGVVYGAAFDDSFNVCHIGVDNVVDLHRLSGSKYIQSSLGDSFKDIRMLLIEGKEVLFCGTPCQTKGLISFVGKNLSQNLLTIDFACHGVPSPKVWEKYRGTHRLKSVSFRNKRYGWKTYSLRIDYRDKRSKTTAFSHDKYMQAFIRNYTLRPSCYHCTAKGIERVSDITLADFWGASKYSPQMNHLMGVSLVFVHSGKGHRLMNAIPKNEIVIKEEHLNDVIHMNPSLRYNHIMPIRRKEFFDSLNTSMTFDELYYNYIREGVTDDLKSWLKTILKISLYYLNRIGIKTIN